MGLLWFVLFGYLLGYLMIFLIRLYMIMLYLVYVVQNENRYLALLI